MRRRINVLQAVGGMNRGGTETWLVNVLRLIDRERYQFTFLKTTATEHAYDREILELGARIAVCEAPRKPHVFVPSLVRLLKSGQFDIVHSHLHYFSGVVLGAAAASGVAHRFAHAHTDTRTTDSAASLPRKGYVTLMRKLIAASMTRGLAVSDGAAEALFGRRFQEDPRVAQFSCGIDLDRFEGHVDSAMVRQRLGIPSDARVIGHVGRFEQPKNHEFLLTLAKALFDEDPSLWLLLVGDGSLRPRILALARSLGIDQRVTFSGSVGDVPTVLRGAMDVFVFPSLWEGLPVAVLEAQAAGLSCVVSNAVPAQAILSPPSVRVLSLNSAVSLWKDAVKERLGATPSRRSALDVFRGSQFDAAVSIRSLQTLYDATAA